MPFGKSIAFQSQYPGTSAKTYGASKESLTAVSPNFYFGAGDPVTIDTSGAVTHAITAVASSVATTTMVVGVAMKTHSLGTWATGTTTATYTSTAANIPITVLDKDCGWWVAVGACTATGNSSTTTASSTMIGRSYGLAYDQIGSSGAYAVFANTSQTVAATSVATSSALTVVAVDAVNNYVCVKPSAKIRHPFAQ